MEEPRKVLISGKRGKLQDRVSGALGRRSGFQAEPLSPGHQLLERARSGDYAAAIFVLDGEQDLESVRWLVESNPSLPLIAVLSAASEKLRTDLRAEGAAEVITTRGQSEAAVRRLLRQRLAAAMHLPRRGQGPGARIEDDVHSIRSSLAAIQGHAEFALTRTRGTGAGRQPLEEIMREVREIERLLRRIDRKLEPSGGIPAK